MPLSCRFIISRNWRRRAPWRTCAEHLIHSSCCKPSAMFSARAWLIPLWTTGLQGDVFIQRCPRWVGAAAGGARIPYQICCLSYTVWPPFTTDGIIICNQSPLNAAHCTICLSLLQVFLSPPPVNFLSSFPFFIVIMNGYDIKGKITERNVFQSHFRMVVERRMWCLVNIKIECG